MTEIPTLLKIDEVCEKIGVKKSTVYKWMDEQNFPRPLKLSPTCVRWREDDVARWLQEIAAASEDSEPTQSKLEAPQRKTLSSFPVSTVDVASLQAQVRLAIENAGGVTVLARALGIKHPAIYRWTRIPAERVLDVEALTGIPCCVLRPDIYPPDRFPPLSVQTL